ncbi:hypothetical protein [Terricaulis sp.]|uniref:hypothetical protein n=1 Tax=Terricaulis sp. TaxID=2768686 RepID=UPI002ADE62D9|nr:hypothetical protein [Terricaulis sp.]
MPTPLRRLVEAIGIVSALLTLIGWLASTFSLIGKMTFWHAAWAYVLAWSLQFPAWVETALIWVGAQAHWVAETFRALVYPIVRWLFQWLPFEIPPIALDLISIAAFGIFGLIRIYYHGQKNGTPQLNEAPLRFALSSGLLAPIMLVQVPFFFLAAWVIENLPKGVTRPLDVVADWLEERVGTFFALLFVSVIMAPFLSAFPLSILLFEWIYVSFLS